MFVCLCKGITDRQIREAICEGASSFGQLQSYLGVSSQCGSCQEETIAILMEYTPQMSEPPLFYAA